MNFGPTEIILIVAVLFLLFGASRLPQLAKSIGQSRKAFRDGMKEAEEEARLDDEEKKLGTIQTPQITGVTDDELLSELRKRAEAKQ